MIRVIIVEDTPILRESIKFIIEQDPEIKVIGCGGNGYEALKLCDELSPNLVLMDIGMPECDGIEGTRLIKLKHKSIKVIILTLFGDDKSISDALKNGADGYVLKDIKPEELILAIKSVDKGLGIIHQSALNNIVKCFNAFNQVPSAKDKNANVEFTEREKSIIRLIVDGNNNKEIASSLYLSEGSVKNIITGILSKLELKDRTQLAVFAVKNNIV